MLLAATVAAISRADAEILVLRTIRCNVNGMPYLILSVSQMLSRLQIQLMVLGVNSQHLNVEGDGSGLSCSLSNVVLDQLKD